MVARIVVEGTAMAIKRIVPNSHSERLVESKEFYGEFLGFDLAMDMDWILTFASPVNPMAQISTLSADASAPVHPDISIEVDDVDRLYAVAREQGIKILYPLTDEPWGVQRFFARDPNGKIINILSHFYDPDRGQ